MTMKIRKASIEEYPDVRAFYHSLIDSLEGTEYHPMWQKDIYPAPEDLKSALEAETLYLGEINGETVTAMVLNKECNDEYADVHWDVDAAQGEFMVIHMLGVHTDHAGKGIAKQMVRFALSHAKGAGMKCVRLDVLDGNVPAERLYPGMGFKYVETVKLFYEDTGWMDFHLYEYDLTKPDAYAVLD